MFAVSATRELRAIGVLLGGSGHAQKPPLQPRPLAALLKSFPLASQSSQKARGSAERRAAGGCSC